MARHHYCAFVDYDVLSLCERNGRAHAESER